MKKLITLLALTLSLNAFAIGGSSQVVAPSLTVAGRVFTDLTNLIILYCQAGISATTTNCTFRKSGGSAGYTPSGSKAFKAYALTIENYNSSTSVGAAAQLLTTTADAGFDTATAFTGPVYLAANGGATFFGSNSVATGVPFQYAIDFVVANTLYLSYTVPGSTSLGSHALVYGYEQ